MGGGGRPGPQVLDRGPRYVRVCIREGVRGPGLYANTLRVVFGAELMCTSCRKQVGEGVSDTFTWILHS